MAGVLEHAVRHDLDGIYNAGADGVLALTRGHRPARQAVGAAAAAVGHRPRRRGPAPRGPRGSRPRCSSSCASAARSTTASSRPPATATRYTTRETVLKLREHQQIAPLLGKRNGDGYRYEREVEEFLRRSPSVVRRDRPAEPVKNVVPGGRRAATAKPRPAAPGRPSPRRSTTSSRPRRSSRCMRSFDARDLEALRRYEEGRAGREPVLRAIDSLLARARSPA